MNRATQHQHTQQFQFALTEPVFDELAQPTAAQIVECAKNWADANTRHSLATLARNPAPDAPALFERLLQAEQQLQRAVVRHCRAMASLNQI